MSGDNEDQSANNAVNQELAESQQQEYYAQQQAWAQEHSTIQAQGGLNWSTQPVNSTTPGAVTPANPPAPPHGIVGNSANSPMQNRVG